MTTERELLETAEKLLQKCADGGTLTQAVLANWLRHAKMLLHPELKTQTRTLIAAEAAREAHADARRGRPKTIIGDAFRNVRKALDRKALLACAWVVKYTTETYAAGPEDDYVLLDKNHPLSRLLEVRRPGWKQALRLGWITSELSGYQVSALGCAIGEVLNKAAGDRASHLHKCVVITWADLLKEAERKP